MSANTILQMNNFDISEIQKTIEIKNKCGDDSIERFIDRAVAAIAYLQRR